jgi:hypothetical protein
MHSTRRKESEMVEIVEWDILDMGGHGQGSCSCCCWAAMAKAAPSRCCCRRMGLKQSPAWGLRCCCRQLLQQHRVRQHRGTAAGSSCGLVLMALMQHGRMMRASLDPAVLHWGLRPCCTGAYGRVALGPTAVLHGGLRPCCTGAYCRVARGPTAVLHWGLRPGVGRLPGPRPPG